MLPVLQTLADSGEIRTVSCADLVADRIGLTPDERVEMLPGGSQRTIVNRTGWAAWYMMQAGLTPALSEDSFKSPTRAEDCWLAIHLFINNKVLEKYPQFIERLRKEKPVRVQAGFRIRLRRSRERQTSEWRKPCSNYALPS